jgi:hypothetical protein
MNKKVSHYQNYLLTFGILAFVSSLLLLTRASSLAQNGTGNPQAVIQGPWPVADLQPIFLKNKAGSLTVIGAERSDGNVELVYLTVRNKAVPSGSKFIGYDNEGKAHNFVEVTSSTAQGAPVQIDMHVYQLETPAKTGFKIVSVAVLGSLQKEENSDSSAEASIQSQVLRVKNDMRSMATAIESYYIDNNSYPAFTTDVAQSIHSGPSQKSPSEGWRLPAFRIQTVDTIPLQFMTLTTPVAYMTRYPDDPFTNQQGHTYQFYSISNGNGWILWSPGPDGKYDIDWQKYELNPEETTKTLNILALKSYDPTNGTISGGDLWRIKQ